MSDKPVIGKVEFGPSTSYQARAVMAESRAGQLETRLRVYREKLLKIKELVRGPWLLYGDFEAAMDDIREEVKDVE